MQVPMSAAPGAATRTMGEGVKQVIRGRFRHRCARSCPKTRTKYEVERPKILMLDLVSQLER